MAPDLLNEPEPFEEKNCPIRGSLLSPLVVVGVANFVLTQLVPRAYGATHEVMLGGHPIVTQSVRWRRSGLSRARCCWVS